MVAILMMLAKLVFWNKGYEVLISSMTLPAKFYPDSNYIVDMVKWPKFGN